MTKQFFIFLLLFALAPVNKVDGHKVESIGALTDAKVPEVLRNVLDTKGLRVLDEKGTPVCELWFSKGIPTTKDAGGDVLGQIGEGTFVGVINFPSGASDFRGQGIKAGYYTLRYGLILQDGNHLGVSPTRDFLLAVPVAEDKDPATRLKTDDLFKLSRAASGTGHPSVWSLVQASSSDGLPKAVKNEHEHVIIETKITTMTGVLNVGLIVVGKTEG
jgi:hypothetical protein